MTLPAGWKPTNEQVALAKEETLWKNQLTEGIIKKRVVEVQTITNYRVLRNDRGVTFRDIDDVVIMNQHRILVELYGNVLWKICSVGYGEYTIKK